MLFLVGEKYYKIADGQLRIVRIVKIELLDEKEIITIKEGARTSKVDSSFFSDFIRLKPAAIINFNLVEMGVEGANDVIVTLVRTKDWENGNHIPYAACRQCITDVFTNMTNRTNQLFLGCSVSIETAPENFDYNSMLGCSKGVLHETVAAYIDDTVMYIHSLLPNKSEFDKVLYKIHKNTPRDQYIGTSKTLYDLLKDNKFQYDFNLAFGIFKIKVKLKFNKDTFELEPAVRKILEASINHEMVRTYVTKYSPTINMNKIEREYILVSDRLDDLYIVAYDKGEYIPDEYRKSIRATEDLKILMGKK